MLWQEGLRLVGRKLSSPMCRPRILPRFSRFNLRLMSFGAGYCGAVVFNFRVLTPEIADTG
jgi:hypothetical protein